ncbi:MAG TPA: hypothetical protein VF710_19105 [Longimicrobium sp.]|jgi:hypothetical protein
MSASLSRTGGCGCGGGPAPTTGHDCGCGCGGKGPRELPGACECAGPERCGIPCLERPVYSAGQLLTADALRLGQRYLEERFALRRYVDGVGVVCGLHVRCDPERPGWVVVEPGYAVDCCGRDIVLCEPVRMDLCAAIARCPRPEDPCGPGEPRFPDAPGDGKERTGAELGGLEESRPRPRDRTRTYVLRAEPVWEGRDPVPVVTRAGACDSGTECRPSREGATVRLCVVPLEGPPGYGRAEERTTEFRQRGRFLMDRLRQALEASSGGKLPRLDTGPVTEVQTGTSPDRAKEVRRATLQRGETAPGRPGDAGRVRAVVDALLRALRDDPAPSACGLYGLLCALRARVGQDAPRAAAGPCDLPPEVEANPEGFLAAVVGHLVDGLREDYLALDCADCCEHTGVRLAHVVVDEALAGCGDGCFVAGIDTHSPSRESLHPRGDWWRGDRVSLYDAYFRGGAEAGVLLSGRGLRVRERDAYQNESPADLPPLVEEWLRMARPAELRRLGLNRSSDLYAPYGAQVVLWTVEGRVVSIEVEDAIPPRVPYDVGRYVRLPLSPGAMEPRPAPGPVKGQPVPAAELDPAPFRETIDGVGDRIEPQLYRAGIRTYDALAKVSYEAFRRVLPTRTPVARELFDSIQAQASEIASGARTWPEEELRAWAADARRTLEQVMVQEGGS